METITLTMKELRVADISARDGTVDLVVYFDNYKTIKSLKIEDPEEIAEELLQDIRQKVKTKNQKDPLEDDPLHGHVNVLIDNDEAIEKRIALFLAKVADRVRAVQNTRAADNYIDMLNDVKTMKLALE